MWLKSRFVIAVTALDGATTKTTLPAVDGDQDIEHYFQSQRDNIRDVIGQAVSSDV